MQPWRGSWSEDQSPTTGRETQVNRGDLSAEAVSLF